jgi:hypothetical protein
VPVTVICHPGDGSRSDEAGLVGEDDELGAVAGVQSHQGPVDRQRLLAASPARVHPSPVAALHHLSGNRPPEPDFLAAFGAPTVLAEALRPVSVPYERPVLAR